MIHLRQMLTHRGVQASVAAFVAALLIAIAATAGAVQLEPLPAPAAEGPWKLIAQQGRNRVSADALEDAVAAAPFAPNRELEGYEANVTAAAADSADLQLIGTVVDVQNGSFVVVSVRAASPRILHPGETFAGYRLHAVLPGNAVFTRVDGGERITLRVPRSR